jgi:ATP-dependent helicase HrpB
VTELPIDGVLRPLVDALERSGRAVLQAPPGAGKTTRVPLALPDRGGRIVMLEPRRLAARAAAERMAETLGESVGETVGYRMRGATRVSPNTRIEVVTEGVLTRMLLSDPALEGVGTVIFDEFHERSLNADLGLALTWEARQALRPDLSIIVMSATLDAEPVAAMLDDAAVITAEGRAFPVETRWLEQPLKRGYRFEDALADLVRTAEAETDGGILVFLPGAPEIRRVEQRLKSLPHCVVRPLYGALSSEEQRAAIAPARGPRKIVLSTSIAETSLTIEDVRVVVDGGLARRQRFDPGSGMARLVTERVSRAEADQRRGRAGRIAAGQCYRLWTRGEEGALPLQAPPEIAYADLARLALDLAIWGDRDAGGLALLTPPPEGALSRAQALLRDLGMIDSDGAPTEHGRSASALPLHPRIAHMVTLAGEQAAPLAAILSARSSAAAVDLAERLAQPLEGSVRVESRRLARSLRPSRPMSLGEMVALAYPDRVARRRPGDLARYLTSGGKGALLPPDEPLGALEFLAIAETDGHPREAQVRSAAAFTESELRNTFADRIEETLVCEWSSRDGCVVTARQETFGALVLSERPWPDAPPERVGTAMLEGARQIGLPWSGAARRFAARVQWARGAGRDLPEMSDRALMDSLEDWLLPFLAGIRTSEAWRSFDILPALEHMLDRRQRARLDATAPSNFQTPLGRQIPIDYSDAGPAVSVRLQELFGLTQHPAIAGQPVRLTLLSPAARPLQVTSDLAAFWAGSYADVRRDMRGRYPKHPWPEDPTDAAPTSRAKRRSGSR